MADRSLDDEIMRRHDEAVARGHTIYTDPTTGRMVLTASLLRARGHCCGSGCRHCPYPLHEQARAGRPGSVRP